MKCSRDYHTLKGGNADSLGCCSEMPSMWLDPSLRQNVEVVQHECTSAPKEVTEVSEFSFVEEGAKFYFSSFLEKTILPTLCLFKLVYPRMSPRLLSSSWRAFNLLGKQ